MSGWKNPNIDPPEETTPEEAERNKRIMGKNEAAQKRKSADEAPRPTAPDTSDKPTA